MLYNREFGYALHLYRACSWPEFKPLSPEQYNRLCDKIEKQIQQEKKP